MITAAEAKQYVGEFKPSQDMIDSIESDIKAGKWDIRYSTTWLDRDYAERCAEYFRNLGYRAYIKDIYNVRTGAKGGSYLKVEI